MFLATNGFIPLRNWMHNYDIKNKYGKTLEDILRIL